MTLKETKRLINNIVANEFEHVQSENLGGMDDLEKYKKIAEEVDKIHTQLFELLPNEYKCLVDDWDCKVWEMLSIEIRHYFKKGVVARTANLNFLIDVTGGMKFY